MIDIPTRVTAVSISLIDLIFINTPDDIICHGTLPRIADHDGILVSFNTKTTKQKQKTKIIYDYKNADIQGLINYIKEIDFNSLYIDIVTCLLIKRDNAHKKSREAANDSEKANRRAKAAFNNTVNNTLRNPSLSAKKKFNI